MLNRALDTMTEERSPAPDAAPLAAPGLMRETIESMDRTAPSEAPSHQGRSDVAGHDASEPCAAKAAATPVTPTPQLIVPVPPAPPAQAAQPAPSFVGSIDAAPTAIVPSLALPQGAYPLASDVTGNPSLPGFVDLLDAAATTRASPAGLVDPVADMLSANGVAPARPAPTTMPARDPQPLPSQRTTHEAPAANALVDVPPTSEIAPIVQPVNRPIADAAQAAAANTVVKPMAPIETIAPVLSANPSPQAAAAPQAIAREAAQSPAGLAVLLTAEMSTADGFETPRVALSMASTLLDGDAAESPASPRVSGATAGPHPAATFTAQLAQRVDAPAERNLPAAPELAQAPLQTGDRELRVTSKELPNLEVPAGTSTSPTTAMTDPGVARGNAPSNPDQIVARSLRVPAHPAVAQVAMVVTKAAQDGVDRITIKLQPPELGRIDVRLDVGVDGRIQAVFAAERSATVDILQRDVRELERALQTAGLSTDPGGLSFGLKQQSGHGMARFGESAPAQDAAIAEGDAVVSPLVSAAARAAADGRLDIHV